jgi:hypothetical protein
MHRRCDYRGNYLRGAAFEIRGVGEDDGGFVLPAGD